MAVNGHFASRGPNGHANFENGVQVIDEDKEFKFVHRCSTDQDTKLTVAVPTWGST